MSARSCKVEPVKRQTSVRRSSKTTNVKPALVSSSSSSISSASRSPFLSQKTPKRVASSAGDNKNARREATKISNSSCESSKWTANFMLTVELRKKMITFRSIVDLPPLTGCVNITNMIMRTMKDLHQLCPGIIESSQILDMRREEENKLFDKFYNALKAIGDSWIDDHEWIIKSKYKNSGIRKNLSDRLVEKVIGALDGVITGMNERLEFSNDEMKKKASPRVKTSYGRLESLGKQPMTPRTVLRPSSNVKDFAISVLNLPRNARMQTLVKLSPIQNLSQKEAQSNNGGDDKRVKGKKSETEKTEKAKEAVLEKEDGVKNQIDDKNCSKVSLKSLAPPLSPPPANAAIPVQAPLPMAAGKGPTALPLPPPGNAAIPVQQPLPMAAGKGPTALPLPPPGNAAIPVQQPLPMAGGKGLAALPLAPPGNAAIPVKPPLPMAAGKGPAAPPPPPPGAKGSFGGKKVASKLKRSTHLGSLFRFLKAKLEGKSQEARSRGHKGVTGSNPANENQGLADSLAEIEKKSPYFQKIEENVRMYMNSINELKTEITKFKNKDSTDLQKFHHHVESVLDKLEDEGKVLSRCEGFPYSKLEAIRAAAALYSKLEGIIKDLKNWKIESPANQLFEKTESYFAKIKREFQTLEQTQAEEEKKYKTNNIHFDFNILVQIKELMVDVSSSCIELALKEKREAKIESQTTAKTREAKISMKTKTAGWAKTLWRAFQFAFNVYKFAGGHDERADKLTRELGEEIEQILGNQ